MCIDFIVNFLVTVKQQWQS